MKIAVSIAMLLAIFGVAPQAYANAPLGACCLADRSCQDLMGTQCDDAMGEFIGDDTSCATIDCSGAVVAPALSIAGLFAGVGLLAGLGIYRVTRRRKSVG